MFRSFALALTALFFSSLPAYAWDAHHWITQYALDGFTARDPALAKALDQPIEVHPLSAFIEKAYGPGYTETAFRAQELEGLGAHYVLEFAEGAQTQLSFDWSQGFSFAQYTFLAALGPTPGRADPRTTPREVLTVYSDEPDWNMDDDVSRLKNVGIADGIVGMGTRVLRHFWYEGQDEMGVSLSTGQELDRRVAAFARVSRRAFQVGEPYWGFRFLADELHYLQDLTQPFHIQAIMSDDMIYTMQGAIGAICDFRRGLHDHGLTDQAPAECGADQSVHADVIRSGWLVSTYHSIYEDFERGLIESNVQGTRDWVTDPMRVHEQYDGIEKLALPPAGTTLDAPGAALAMVRQAQGAILNFSDPVAQGMLKVFTNAYRFDPAKQASELLKSTHADSIGYRMGIASFYDFPLTSAQALAKDRLVDATHAALGRAGAWTRALIEKSLADAGALPARR